MIIENPEAFKVWLTSVLEPLCDADPQALGKYVYALVKKDMPVEDLRKTMIDQLDVFLQKETKPFVELLFKTLEKQEYLTIPAEPIPNANPPNPVLAVAAVAASVVNKTEPKEIIPVSSLPDLNVVVVPATVADTLDNNNKKTDTQKRDVVRPKRLSDTEKEEKPSRLRGKHRHRSTSRSNRSRSRSWDRMRRNNAANNSPNRSPHASRTIAADKFGGKDTNERRERTRSWRNKSPPIRGKSPKVKSPNSGYKSPTYKSARSKSPLSRVNNRNISPVTVQSTATNVSQGRRADHRSRLSRSPNSPLLRNRSPPQNYRNHETRVRYRTRSPRSRSRSRSIDRNERNQENVEPRGTSYGNKRRCRDFDEKGYCMRGELCVFDHGVDPVVVEDTTSLANVFPFAPNGQPSILAPQMIRGGPIMHPNISRPLHPPNVPPPEYNPRAPSIWGTRMNGPPGAAGPGNMYHPGLPPPNLMMQPPPHLAMNGPPPMHLMTQRDIINVPLVDGGNMNGAGANFPQQQPPGVNADVNAQTTQSYHNDMTKKKSNFDYNRLGGMPRGSKNPINCSLELRKVPSGMNNITHLNNHFGKFGKIVNIQVNYEGDPEAALISFSSHAEANAAYKSTEAVLNNRFIKVFWHSADASNANNVAALKQPIKERLGSQNKVYNAMKVNNIAKNQLQTNNATNTLTNTSTTNSVTVTAPSDTSADVKPSDTTAADEKLDSTPPTTAVPSPMVTSPSVTVTMASPTTTTANYLSSKLRVNTKLRKSQAIHEQIRKKHEETRKEAAKIANDLIKRKQDLLEKQLNQQKILIAKMEKADKGATRDALKNAINDLQQSIESTRKSIVTTVKQRNVHQTAKSVVGVAHARKGKDELQKELLDAELDLISKQQEGKDTIELQKRIFELKRQLTQLSVPVKVTRAVMPGSRTFRATKFVRSNSNSGAGAVTVNSGAVTAISSSVDHRPTNVLVSGYEADEEVDVLAHFSKFGKICDFVSDNSTPSVILNFKTRKEAEMAMIKGKQFQDRVLTVTWCTLNNQLQRTSSRMSISEDAGSVENVDKLLESAIVDEDHVLGDLTLHDEEALLQDEEDDDENSEDRSWRR